MNKTEIPIIGTWQLMTWKSTDENGEQCFPFGEDALGYLIYSEAGFMSLHLSHKHRELFQSPSVFNVTKEEALESYLSYSSYCGRYEVKEDKVLHYVLMHTSPNWVETVQVRNYKVEGDILHLSHRLEGSCQDLLWNKII